MPMANVIDNWLIVPFLVSSQFHYAKYMIHDIEVIKKLAFHLVPTYQWIQRQGLHTT